MSAHENVFVLMVTRTGPKAPSYVNPGNYVAISEPFHGPPSVWYASRPCSARFFESAEEALGKWDYVRRFDYNSGVEAGVEVVVVEFMAL